MTSVVSLPVIGLDMPVRAHDLRELLRAGTREPKLDAVLGPEDLRLASLPPPPGRCFFLDASPTGLMRHSVPHCSASLGWFDLTWST